MSVRRLPEIACDICDVTINNSMNWSQLSPCSASGWKRYDVCSPKCKAALTERRDAGFRIQAR
jgi:hypothetical protein